MKGSYITSAGAFLVGALFTLWVTSSHPPRTGQAEEKRNSRHATIPPLGND
jgi:hypothetical protein